MDFGLIEGINQASPSYTAFEPARLAMGDTLRYAERMDLINMSPQGDLSSTGYALANPGKEYLILQPGEQGGSFTVSLDPGTYRVEWYNVNTRETIEAEELNVEYSGSARFTALFEDSNPAVLYLMRKGN